MNRRQPGRPSTPGPPTGSRSRTAATPRRVAAPVGVLALVLAAGLFGADTDHPTTTTTTGLTADTTAQVVVERAQPRDGNGSAAPAADLAGMHHNPAARFRAAQLSTTQLPGARSSVAQLRTEQPREAAWRVASAAGRPGLVVAQAASVDQVLTNIRNLILGLAGGFVLVCWSVAGTRYLLSQGDPSEIERAKSAFRAGVYGFGLVILAPLGVTILRGIVGL